MGKQISKYDYQKHGSDGLMKPIIFCRPDEALEKRAIAVNIRIAERLTRVAPARRSLKLPGILDAVLAELPRNSTIKDFDVLFHPDYQIDVLQLLIAACKKNEFTVIWSGTYRDRKLLYAEPGCPDFKRYDLDKYDVTCII